jgi:hypothetical protein
MKKINKTYVFILLFVFIVSSGISQSKITKNNDPMKITSIELEHTNPSMGSHETIITISLIASEQNTKRITQFVNKSMMNNTTSLYNYFKALENNDLELLKKVSSQKKDYNNDLPKGREISNLTFHFSSGKTITFKDVYHQYNLTHFYPDFTSYMVENGTKSNSTESLLKRDDEEKETKIDTTKWN